MVINTFYLTWLLPAPMADYKKFHKPSALQRPADEKATVTLVYRMEVNAGVETHLHQGRLSSHGQSAINIAMEILFKNVEGKGE